MDFRCNYCTKDYRSYQSLWNHNKKFHSNNNDICTVKCTVKRTVKRTGSVLAEENKEDKYKCSLCNKIFKSRQNKWDHEKNYCKEKDKNINDLQKKITINNNQIVNNINNGTINNTQNIVINQIGRETVDCLPLKDILKIIGDGNNMPITCIKKVNFNKNLPENHSFCTTTLEGKHFTRINHKTQKPEKINKIDFINEILDSSLRFIQNISLMVEFDESFRETIPLEYQNKLKDILNNQEKFHDSKNKKAFFNCINDMSYNFKDIIIKTWKLIQQHNNSDEELLIDENFNYIDSSDEDN
jgi:hypothetical protein